MVFSEKSAHIGHQFCVCFFYILQQFAYKINSRMRLSGTYCIQCVELLIAFCNCNSTQNSSVEKQYGIQKPTNFKLLSVVLSEKSAIIVLNIFSHWTPILYLYIMHRGNYCVLQR